MRFDPLKAIKSALKIHQDREKVYGSVEEDFARAASLASLWLNKPLTARDIVLVLASVKMSRIATTPDHEDSFIDLCNYVSFGAAFSQPIDHDEVFADAVEEALGEMRTNGTGA